MIVIVFFSCGSAEQSEMREDAASSGENYDKKEEAKEYVKEAVTEEYESAEADAVEEYTDDMPGEKYLEEQGVSTTLEEQQLELFHLRAKEKAIEVVELLSILGNPSLEKEFKEEGMIMLIDMFMSNAECMEFDESSLLVYYLQGLVDGEKDMLIDNDRMEWKLKEHEGYSGTVKGESEAHNVELTYTIQLVEKDFGDETVEAYEVLFTSLAFN